MSFETPQMKQLRKEWYQEAMRRGYFGTNDLISRKAVHDNIGELELFAYLTDEDIQEHGLHVDEYGEFYFTEEQGRIAGLMYVLMRRYIEAFPSAEEAAANSQIKFPGLSLTYGTEYETEKDRIKREAVEAMSMCQDGEVIVIDPDTPSPSAGSLQQEDVHKIP